MPKALGYSLYLSAFAAQCPALRGTAGAPVFVSLHISEEFDDTYCRRAEELCHMLAERGFRILADVSVKTVQQFGCESLAALAKHLRLWALRIDYGFSREEIAAIAREMPIVLNASTTSAQDAAEIAAGAKEVYAMHNFYPRPETGLDSDYLLQTTRSLQAAGLKVMAFIPGDTQLRGPVFEGLPTLEAHRGIAPSAAFVDLALRYGMDEIFVADPGISEQEQQRIARFCRDDVIPVPALLAEGYENLYDAVFTCRVDSPRWLIRFQESRVYSCKGKDVAPENCGIRSRGTITIDNVNYGRYTGEIQLIRSDLKADPRVNVIGSVPESAWLLLDCIRGGQKFMLVRP